MEGKKNYYKKTYKATEKIPAYKPKRGAQSKLMTEDEKQKAGIHELSYDLWDHALMCQGMRTNSKGMTDGCWNCDRASRGLLR